jgi:hypothetical protein
MALVALSPPAQVACIGISIIRIGVSLWKHCNRHKRAAAKCITSAEEEVAKVFKCVDDDNVYNIDDYTEAAGNAVDVIDTSVAVRRKVRKRCKAPFRAYLVKIGKAKFGLLRRTEANFMCVRKYLYDECVTHGVLARHIVQNVDFAAEMVFIPMAYELEKLAIKHTQHVYDSKTVAGLLGDDLGSH